MRTVIGVVIVVKYLVIHLYIISCVQPDFVIAVDFARILNRILDYWQPYDIYVILNSTITSNANTDADATGDNVIGAMIYPRYVSAEGDFSSFIQNHNQQKLKNPIRSVFPDNFVLVMFTDDSCQNVIPILRNQLSKEIIVKRSKILVVALHFMANDDGDDDDGASPCWEGMFRELWMTMGLLNVFVLDGTFIYGFNPFTKSFLIRYLAEDYKCLIAIDRAANLYGAALSVPQIDVYPGLQRIIWRNASKQIGTYFFVQKPFAQFFNATLLPYTPKDIDFGFEVFINSTSSIVHPGIGNDLVQGLGDLTLTPRSYDNSNYFDFLSPLNFRECNLMIPKSGRVPQYKIVMRIACRWLRLLSLVVLVTIGALAGLVKKVLRMELKMSRLIFELASVYVGQSLRFPIDKISMRFIVACWLLTCILLGTLFNAEIVMGFLTPMYVKDYDYPFDVIQRSRFGGDVYAFDDFVYFLKGNSKKLFPSDEMFQLLLKKLKGVSRDEFFQRVLHPNKKDMFMVISMADNLLQKTKYLTEQTYSYHKTKPFFISLTANIVPRGSIIYNHYNDFNYRIFEAGLLQHWKNLELLYEIKFGSCGSGGNGAQENSLTIEDLYSAFLVLVLGYALALAAFAMERYFGG